MERTDREPCPWRIIDDAGGAFVFGLVGGTIWHTVGGARNAPKGQRIVQALSRARARVPILGGSFAIWGVLFSCCDCTFTHFRKKEDPWNAILSGATTGGILAARAGMKAAGRSALAGGVILAAIEGLNLVLMRVLMPSMEQQQSEGMVQVDTLLPPNDPSRPRASRNSHKPLWQSNAAPSPLYAADPTPAAWEPQGFSLDNSSTFNTSSGGFDSASTTVVPDSGSSQAASSWKFW